MTNLSKKALMGFIRLQVVLVLLLFLPAWSLRFWQAWIYFFLFFTSTLIITLYFLRHDPSLIERRLEAGPHAEQQKSQKIIIAVAAVLSCALVIVPGFDYRLHWSAVPIPVVLFSDVVVVLGFLTCFFAFRENSYAGSVVKVEANQKVVSTGPYRFVRHPIYAGAALMFLATPISLGSLWALLVTIPLCGVLVARILNEERYLFANLQGYKAYCQKVHYRLIPFVW